MAWPFTPITAYVAGTTPTIKAYDLNQLQAYVNNWINGTKSVKKMLADGTGDASNTYGNGTCVAKRYYSHGGTALASGDWSIGAGWGATGTKTSISGDDQMFVVEVTAGGGTYSADATIVVTFKDGTWTSVPRAMAVIEYTDDATATSVLGAGATYLGVNASCSATACTLTYKNTPVAGKLYRIKVLVLGS